MTVRNQTKYRKTLKGLANNLIEPLINNLKQMYDRRIKISYGLVTNAQKLVEIKRLAKLD